MTSIAAPNCPSNCSAAGGDVEADSSQFGDVEALLLEIRAGLRAESFAGRYSGRVAEVIRASPVMRRPLAGRSSTIALSFCLGWGITL